MDNYLYNFSHIKNLYKPPKLSIIVPCYKKEQTIKQELEHLYYVMSNTRWDFEIIAVVDGFLDKTFEEAQKVRYKNVLTLGYKTNKGKGYAVRYGMAKAHGEYIAFIDSGGDINPNGISMILEHMEWYNADIIVASKRHPASKVKYTLMRKLYSFGYFYFVKLLFGINITDTQSGLKVYKRAVLESVLPRLVVKAFAFDIELLAVAYRLGFKRIYEAPIESKIDFSSTGSTFNKFKPLFLDTNIRRMLRDTLAVFYRMHFLKYYDNKNKQLWKFDKELQMRINTGEMSN